MQRITKIQSYRSVYLIHNRFSLPPWLSSQWQHSVSLLTKLRIEGTNNGVAPSPCSSCFTILSLSSSIKLLDLLGFTSLAVQQAGHLHAITDVIHTQSREIIKNIAIGATVTDGKPNARIDTTQLTLLPHQYSCVALQLFPQTLAVALHGA